MPPSHIHNDYPQTSEAQSPPTVSLDLFMHLEALVPLISPPHPPPSFPSPHCSCNNDDILSLSCIRPTIIYTYNFPTIQYHCFRTASEQLPFNVWQEQTEHTVYLQNTLCTFVHIDHWRTVSQVRQRQDSKTRPYGSPPVVIPQ